MEFRRVLFRSPGTRQPVDDERLLQLYWNRAELKKELSRLQDERHKLLEQLRSHEATFARHHDQLLHLEKFLGNRSEERRVGKECVSSGRSRSSPYIINKTKLDEV